jgi:hypothetical protein
MAITQEDIDRRVAATKPIQPQMGAGEQFLTGLGGAANQVLFGLPEFIARKVQGDELVNKWIQDRQGAWDVGSTVGGVGSFFIPGGALAKGLGMGAKALGAGKIASGLDKAADVIKGAQSIGKSPITQKAIQGVAGALEQGIPRALVETAQTGDIGKAGENLLAGAALGGGLGAGAGLLSKGLGTLAKRGAEQLGELGEKARTGTASVLGLNKAALRRDLKVNTIRGFNSNQAAANLDRSVDSVLDLADDPKLRLFTEAGRGDRIASELAEASKGYDDLLVGSFKRDPELAGVVRNNIKKNIEGLKGNPEFSGIASDAMDKFDDVAAKIDDYLKTPTGVSNMRQGFDAKIKSLRRKQMNGLTDDAADAELAAYQTALDSINETIDQVAPGALGEMGKRYRALKMLSMSDVLDKMGDLNFGKMGGGSPTMEKLLTGAALGGGSGLASGESPEEVLKRAAIGSVIGGSVNRLIPKLTQRAMPLVAGLAGKGQDLLEGIAAKAPGAMKIAQNVPGQIGAGAASMADLTGGPVAEAAPEMEPEAVEQDVLGAIFNRLDQKWNSTNAQYYGPADPSNPYYAQWARGAIDQAMPGGQLDPIIAGKILGQNKEQADQIAQALAASRAIKQNVAQAGEMGGGILGIGQSPTEQAQLARQLIQGSLGDVGSKAGITQKQVDQAVQQILGGGGTMQEKVQKLMQLQSAYNPQTMAYLSQMGAV